MNYYKASYFKVNYWNYIESSSFIVYISFLTIRILNGFAKDPTFVEIVLSMFLMVAGFFKVLSFMRIYEQFGFLVQMVFLTIEELVGFTLFFIMWICFFAICFITLQVDFSGITDYPGVHQNIVAFIEVYQSSIGNIKVPNYESAISVYGTGGETTVLMKIIWFLWILNQFINLIILLNFLIALISEVYANVMEKQQVI